MTIQFVLPFAGITLPPEPLNTTLGSIATFTCSVVGDDVGWSINGMSANNPALAMYEVMITTDPQSNILMSTLTLRASTEGSITIQCVAFTLSSSPAFSPEVSLMVQGIHLKFKASFEILHGLELGYHLSYSGSILSYKYHPLP